MSNKELTKDKIPLKWWKPALFFTILIVGIFYVKWFPYYNKAFTAAQTHDIGLSVLTQLNENPILAAFDYTKIYFLAVWKAALLGLLLGSLVQVLIPRSWLIKVLGKNNFLCTFSGIIFSLPGMMCSCCAAPVAAGMRKQNVTMGGALAFWIGNPLLNPATLVFIYFVLGWYFFIIRLIAGLVTVFFIATFVPKIIDDDTFNASIVKAITPEARQNNLLLRWLKALWSLCLSVIPIYIITVFLLGALSVLVFPHTTGVFGNTIFWVIVMAIVGCLFVIPTAAEVPIIKTLMLAGMGLSPALALLITLPAVSLPSLIMLRKSFPVRALWLVGILVIVCGIISGFLGLLIS